jgi:hypothetical protein
MRAKEVSTVYRQAMAPHSTGPRGRQRGAALLISIAILTILVAIGLTFFSVSRLDLRTATNATNAVRVDMLNDAANAIAIHHLNQYFFRHPTVTSNDHSFRTQFEGTWAAGKSWARRKQNPGDLVGLSLLSGGVPELDLNRIKVAIEAGAQDLLGTGRRWPVVLSWPDGHREELFKGPRSNEWLFIPRFQSGPTPGDPFQPTQPDFILLYDDAVQLRLEDGIQYDDGAGTFVADITPAGLIRLAALNDNIAALGPEFNAGDVQLAYFADDLQAYPFVTPAIYRQPDYVPNDIYLENLPFPIPAIATGYPEEVVDAWADIDNNGDGQRDSMWMPIPQDLFFPSDEIDNDLDGMIDETQDNDINDDRDLFEYPAGSGTLASRTDYAALDGRGNPVQDPDGIIVHDEDEAIEAGVLVYNGLGPIVELESGFGRIGDGLDNDGNGLVDEPAEDRLFLTAPFPGIRIPLDLDGDGVASTVEKYTFESLDLAESVQVDVFNPAIIIPDTIFVPRVAGTGGRGPIVIFDVPLTSADVDVLDNDYDLLINDYYTYAYFGPYQPGSYNGTDSAGPGIDPGWQPKTNWDGAVAGNFAVSPSAYATQIQKSYSDIHRDVWISGATLSGTWVNPESPNLEPVAWNDTTIPGTAFQILRDSLRVTHSGEPVTELVGRAAIHITDEASKINLNVAGAERYEPFPSEPGNLMAPALSDGTGPEEYDLRAVPGIGFESDGAPKPGSGKALASKIAGFRAGGPRGVHLPRNAATTSNPGGQTEIFPVDNSDGDYDANTLAGIFPYRFDISLPGYGRVDDNGNALLASVDGVDNMGDGVVDTGLMPLSPAEWPTNFDEVIDYKNTLESGSGGIQALELAAVPGDTSRFQDPLQLRFAQYYFRLGQFEGIDEPAEFQRFSPLANRLAETDARDNNGLAFPVGDGYEFTDEAGEFGDTFYQTRGEIREVINQIGPELGSVLDRVGTMYSTDKDLAFLETEAGIRAISKIDINRATPKQLAARLLLSNPLESSLNLLDRTGIQGLFDGTPWTTRVENSALGNNPGRLEFGPARFAAGLRQGGLRLEAHKPNNDPNKYGGMLYTRADAGEIDPIDIRPAALSLPLDPQLEALQLAASIVDSRDTNHARSLLVTEQIDTTQDVEELASVVNFPGANDLNGRELVPAGQSLPLEELQENLESVLNTGEDARPLDINDEWWQDRVSGATGDPLDIRPEQRKISYAAAGVESIRINELMVRPVRRVEAEAVPSNAAGANADDPVNFTFGPASYANLDPSPFNETFTSLGDVVETLPTYLTGTGGNVTYIDSTGDAIMPEFALGRRAIIASDFALPALNPAFATTWDFETALPVPLLGENTGAVTDGTSLEYEFPTPNAGGLPEYFRVPDIIQFEFADTDLGGYKDGLPDGRYYLTAKLEERLGVPVAELIAQGRLHYSIKYVPAGGNDIKTDLALNIAQIEAEGAAAATPAAAITAERKYYDEELQDYFRNNWARVSPLHLANGPGEPADWLFLDAQPAAKSDAEPGYFIEWPPAVNLDTAAGDVRISFDYVNGTWVGTFNFQLDALAVLASQNYVVTITFDSLPARTFDLDLGGGIGFGSRKLAFSNAEFLDMFDGGTTIGIVGFGAEPIDFGPGAGNTHTVGIPAAGSGYTLVVAFTTSYMDVGDLAAGGVLDIIPYVDAARPPDPEFPLGINFFDFSQEPDHEWVELANVSDDVIDLSGWTLEVGAPRASGVDFTPFNSEWRVPVGTTIAPGGMLLLSFAKFDAFDTPGGADAYPPFMSLLEQNLLSKNGMGLARSNALFPVPASQDPVDNLDLSNVTVPAIFDTSSNTQLYDPNSWMSDVTGGVFDRPVNPLDDSRSDYVDAFGAGISPSRAVLAGNPQRVPGENALTPDYQQALNESLVQSTANLAGPDQPWDRIVQMENVRLWHAEEDLLLQTSEAELLTTRDIDSVDRVARFVLRGGVLPNYPERDGYDNDGDGGYLDERGFYQLGTLEKDMVDNDLDGFIDEQPLKFNTAEPTRADRHPFTGEGVDEGRLGLIDANVGLNAAARRYGAGGFEFGTLPAIFHQSRDRRLDLQENYDTALPEDFASLDDGGYNPQVSADVFRDAVPQASLITPPIFENLGAGNEWRDSLGAVVSTPDNVVINLPGAVETYTYQGALDPDNTFVPIPGQTYIVELNYTLTAGELVLRLGDDAISLPARASFTAIPARVLMHYTGGAAALSITASDCVATLPTGGGAVVPFIAIFPIDPANTPGSTSALGLTANTALANDGVLYAGNANAFRLTQLGSLYNIEDVVNGLPYDEDALYLGSDLDAPDWKAFVERRFYPGDNVIVSLYDADGNVADRTTYREYDVINRTIDDVVASPYAVPGYHLAASATEGLEDTVATLPDVFDIASLHPSFPSMWLPDQMGLDFYRSLERKNPLDPGDRFGTTNRWEATDGNYDDWSDSLSVFARVRLLGTDNYQARPLQTEMPGNLLGGTPSTDDLLEFSRFYSANLLDFAAQRTNVEDHLRLYGHALSGSPLRMNTAYRQTVNPLDQYRAGMLQQGSASLPLVSSAGDLPVGTAFAQFYTEGPNSYNPDYTGDNLLASLSWQNRVDYTPVRNEPFASGLDMARVPHLTREHFMFNGARGRTADENYLHDVTALNFYTNTGDLRAIRDVSQRSVLAMQRPEGLADGTVITPLTLADNTFSTNSLVLTVAQADFRPIRPRLFVSGGGAEIDAMDESSLPEGQTFQNLLQWFPSPGSSSTALLDPPAAWSPVFLYAMHDGSSTVNNGFANDRAPELASTGIPGLIDDFGDFQAPTARAFPFYPPYVDGRSPAPLRIDPLPALLRPQFVFSVAAGDVLPALNFANIDPGEIQARSPLQNRVVMYVSKPRDLAAGGVPMADTHRPEALWIWDGEDGLENGEYEVYIGTYMPGFTDGLQNLNAMYDTFAARVRAGDDDVAALLPAHADPTDPQDNPAVTTFAETQLLPRDIRNTDDSSAKFRAVFNIDVITDRTLAQGQSAPIPPPPATLPNLSETFGLVHPEDWNPAITYRANEDGYVFYGADAADGWQPIIVRVTDNFLALRVRNAGDRYDIGAVSHIVLAPRKRTAGRVNINTANMTSVPFGTILDGTRQEHLWHPLAGAPGMLELGGAIPFRDLDRSAEWFQDVYGAAADYDYPAVVPPMKSVQPANANGDVPWSSPGDFLANLPLPLVPPTELGPLPVSADGGYGVRELADQRDIDDAAALARLARYQSLALLQRARTEHPDGRYYESASDLLSEAISIRQDPLVPDSPALLHPLTVNEVPEERAVEILERFGKLGPSITTRSDVFEILVTVQSGYGIDADGDGRYNYRDNNEFITNAETRSRMVYERRTPTDNSDESASK